MNYEDLTKRIDKAERCLGRADRECQCWWDGYIAGLRDVRNDFNTGDKK